MLDDIDRFRGVFRCSCRQYFAGMPISAARNGVQVSTLVMLVGAPRRCQGVMGAHAILLPGSSYEGILVLHHKELVRDLAPPQTPGPGEPSQEASRSSPVTAGGPRRSVGMR